MIASQLDTTWEARAARPDRRRDSGRGRGVAGPGAAGSRPDHRKEAGAARKDERGVPQARPAGRTAEGKTRPGERRRVIAGSRSPRLAAQQGIAYCIADGRLLASNSVKNLERLIDRGVDYWPQARASLLAAGKADGALAALAALAALEGDPGEAGAGRRWRGRSSISTAFERSTRRSSPTQNQPDTGVTLLFGSWYEAFRKAPAATASIRWSDTELAANVDLAQPKEGRGAGVQGIHAGRGQGGGAAHPAAGHDRLAEPVARLAGDLGVEGRLVLTRDRPGFRPARHVCRPVLRRS